MNADYSAMYICEDFEMKASTQRCKYRPISFYNKETFDNIPNKIHQCS